MRRLWLVVVLLGLALGLASIAIAGTRPGSGPAVRDPAVPSTATSGNVHRLGEYDGKSLQVGDIVAQMEKQPDGSCKSNGPVGVSSSDEPGEGGRVVLETDAECAVRIKEITSEVPIEKRAPGGVTRD